MTTPPADEVGLKLLFENHRARVWDFALGPGESLAKHTHRTDYFFIAESGGLMRVADPDKTAEFHDVQSRYHGLASGIVRRERQVCPSATAPILAPCCPTITGKPCTRHSVS